MSALVPPGMVLSWTATALGADFGGYNLYRRRARAQAGAWEHVAAIRVRDGYSAAAVEAHHRRFIDTEAGWRTVLGGPFDPGHDYAVTVLQLSTGGEATIAATQAAKQVARDSNPWVCSNAAPWVNHPLQRATPLSGQDEDSMTRWRVAGRDLAVTRTRLELPGRTYDVSWDEYAPVGEDQIRYWRAAAAAGVPVALHTPLGDRVIGTPGNLSGIEHSDVLYLRLGARFVETSRASQPAEFNLPAGLILDGTNDFISLADNTLLNPGSSAFSIVVAAAFAGSAGSDYALSKGNIAGAANGYALRTTGSANELQFFIRGAGGNGGPTDTDATWFDGDVHVAVATSSTTAQKIYRDGGLTPVETAAVAHGAVTNAVALAVGADNAGASAFMAASPVVAWAVYLRELTAEEAQAAAYYLLGYPGYRMPYGPSAFHDLRDDTCWDGIDATTVDLSGNNLVGTISGAPATRGIPWPLSNLEAFV